MAVEMLSLGVIGSPVTFAGQAAHAIASRLPILGSPRYFSSGEAMIAAVLCGEVDAVVGGHASSAGGYTNFGERLMGPDSKLHVIFEAEVSFGCCVLAKRGARLDEIEVVHGGPASLPFARTFVAQNMPQARCAQYSSSTGLIDGIASGTGREAMLGTLALATQSGLDVLAQNIDGDGPSGNWWLISTKPLFAAKPATIFVSLRAIDDGRLGRLVSGLSPVGFQLSTIAARPTGGRLLEFDYLLRLRGAGRLSDVLAVIDAAEGARLVGAVELSAQAIEK